MFDFQSNDSCDAGNSEMNCKNNREAMSKAKSSIADCPLVLSGISHEMRTHMNAIVAFSFLLKENCIHSSESNEYSSQVLNSCEQLIGLFDSFLDTAILNTGKFVNDARFWKPDNLLDDLLPEFREIIKKHDNNIVLITDNFISDSEGVFLDKNKIFKVLRCLFQVSLKSTNTGYIKIGYQYNNQKITFCILDSGQGYFKCKEFLHTEDLNESLLIHNDVPSAINITLAKKLIHILGGTILIERNGPSGTGFYLSIPVTKTASPDIPINRFVNTMISI